MANAARHLTVKLAVIKAIQKAAGEAEKATKTALAEVMDPGDRKTAALGDRNLGTVSYSKTSPTAKVTDADAFAAWVLANHPTEVEEPAVTVPADDLLHALLHVRGDEAPEGRNQRKTWHDAYVRVQEAIARVGRSPVTVRPAFTKTILALAEKTGMAVDATTGEEVPGITVTPGGAAGYIAARVSDEQQQSILEAWAAGELDLLELATTHPQALPPATH